MRKLSWFLSTFNTIATTEWGINSNVHLDMGCGNNPRNPFRAKKLFGADILKSKALELENRFEYLKMELDGVIPLEAESVDSISGFDFIEHLPRGSNVDSNLFIKFMNEAFRVLRGGGILFLVTPAFPSSAAFQDPTHVNFISENTVNYFVGKTPAASSLGYGFNGNFKLITQEWVGPLSLIWGNLLSETSESVKRPKLLRLFRSFSSVRSARIFISSIRKPTHLLWILEKSN